MAKQMHDTLFLANSIHDVVFRRFGDSNVLPYVHCSLAFVYHVSFYPDANAHVSPEFPWKLLSMTLNTLLISFGDYDAIEKEDFPDSKDFKRPLPEDYAMHGLLWADRYHPLDFFANDQTDDEEKYMEVPSMEEVRTRRILWLGVRIARHSQSLCYIPQAHRFTVAPQFEVGI